jgi:putative endonuclease
MRESWVSYLLLCADGKIYCGVTNDMGKRLDAHNRGIASRFTRARLPVTLLATSRTMGKAEAFRLEYRIKRLPKNKKLAALTAAQRRPRTGKGSGTGTIGRGNDCGY